MKTSDLFRRAKQLADLEGSDFISWNEAENCINESYIGLYEKLINMGDNSFVQSFHTSEKEVELPKDFWQLKGVYLWNNGNMQTINRRADNNGIHHLSYELRNGKLYLFGNPNDVLVEYFQKPKKLYMPPSDCEVSLDLPEGAEVLACYEHTFVYKTQDTEQNDIINVYDLDGFKNAEDIFEYFNASKIWLCEDYVFTIYQNTLADPPVLYVYNFSTGASGSFNNEAPIITEDGELFVGNNIYNIYSLKVSGDTVEHGTSYEQPVNLSLNSNNLNVSNRDFTDFYIIGSSNVLYHYDIINQRQTSLNVSVNKIIYFDNKCYYLNNKLGYFEDGEETVLKNIIGSPVGFIGINENTGYGYCTKKYNKYFVCAYCEDTELIFPNSFYFQMLSYILAISFRCKQGADITLLSSQLAMIEQTFEDTLGSDAFQYPRMGNVYR